MIVTKYTVLVMCSNNDTGAMNVNDKQMVHTACWLILQLTSNACYILIIELKMSQKWWQTFWKEQKHLAENGMTVYSNKCEVKLNLMISDEL